MKIMKKLIILLAMSFSLHAQTDSTKVTFSEEKVEKFEKTTLIDEYEKAFGGNRMVKSGLRVFATDPGLLNSNLLGIQLEKKIGKSFSLIAEAGYMFNMNTSQSSLEGSMEARYYFNMKNRIKNGLQKSNITGNYIAIKYQVFENEIPNYYRMVNLLGSRYQVIGGFVDGIFLEKSNISLKFGKQFGNTLNLGFQFGVKKGYIIDQSNSYKDYGKNKFPFFVSMQNQVGFGLLSPNERSKSKDYCEFLKCNFNNKDLFKLNINNTLYIDKSTQDIKLDLAFEQKIANSAFSINSNLFQGLKNWKISEISHYKDTTFVSPDGTEYKGNIAVFSQRKYNNLNYEIGLKEQLRYYIGQKKKILAGKQGNNLNGLYSGLEYLYQINKTLNGKIINLSFPNRTDLQAISGIIGYQTLTNKNSFLDINIALGFESIKSFGQSDLPRDWFNQTHFEIGIKLGLAK